MLDGDNSSGKLKPILFFPSIHICLVILLRFLLQCGLMCNFLRVESFGRRHTLCCYTVKMDLIAKRLDHQLGKKREKIHAATNYAEQLSSVILQTKVR